jgi:hypothetical protein
VDDEPVDFFLEDLEEDPMGRKKILIYVIRF